MNAQEIVNELKAGKTVAILSDDAFEFMREVERRNIPCEGITMRFTDEGQCVMAADNHVSPTVKDGRIVMPNSNPTGQ